MQHALAKLVTTIGGLTFVLVLIALGVDGSRSRAEDYPTYPDKKKIENSYCTSKTKCITCPKDNTVVYGAEKDVPDLFYTQGSCGDGYPGAQATCYGTHWGCRKMQCQNGHIDNPPQYQYKGNWCTLTP